MATILVFFCLLENEPLLPRLRGNILLNFEFENKATRANLKVNKRMLKWWPFWNKVYSMLHIKELYLVILTSTLGISTFHFPKFLHHWSKTKDASQNFIITTYWLINILSVRSKNCNDALLNSHNIEGFHAKRAYIAFWADCYFLQDWANFWQTDLFWHKKHHCITVFVDLRLFFEK